MNKPSYSIRNAYPDEFEKIGQLVAGVYAQLEGFPKQSEQPAYYHLLLNVGAFTEKPQTELLVAVSNSNEILGAVLYFNDMQYYGSDGIAPRERDAAGFRLLAVAPEARGLGIGKLLTNECIQRARNHKRRQLIIHSTAAMQTAWKMYEGMGFRRSEDLDFMQGELAVYGFRLYLT